MIIRTATAADLPQLAAQYRAFFLEDGIATAPHVIEANLGHMIEDPRAVILVAETDAGIEGFAAGSLTFGVEFGWSAELEDLYVAPSCRGLGWARRLAAAVVDWAEDKGAEATFLVITPEAESEQGLTAFYERLGFRDSGRITMFKAKPEPS